MKHKEEKQTFKSNLERLELISQKLEDESLDLEDAIKLYDEGIVLTDLCLRTLQDAELKITELKKSLPINKTKYSDMEDNLNGDSLQDG